MKLIRLIRPLVFLFFVIACAGKNDRSVSSPGSEATLPAPATDTFETGKVISPVRCAANPDQSYALYIPANGNRYPLPVIYFFDPHGDGMLPVVRYKALADRFGFILLGSNDSKNGNDWTTTENIWMTISGDSQKRLGINVNRIYTCGFSGGAKVAGYIAINHPEVKGVIAGGAVMPDATASDDFRFSFTAIAGEGDLNMTDIAAFSAALDNTKTIHRLIFFDGIHEWAPENTMSIAVIALQFDAVRQKLIPPDDDLISNYIAESKKRVADYTNAKNYIKAEADCRVSISLLTGLSAAVDWFRQKSASLKNNPVYQKQWQARQNLLMAEQKLKEEYGRQFQPGDMNYWTATIRDLQANAKPATGEGAMHQRLLAYLSLAFYSISNQLITQNRDQEANHFVALYKMADATNPEAWYFSAILNARNHNAQAASDDLIKAVANGFTEKNRLRQQREFQDQSINLVDIESRMKMQNK